MGLRGKAEYRQHFYGEDEQTARAAIEAIQHENGGDDILKGVLSNGS